MITQFASECLHNGFNENRTMKLRTKKLNQGIWPSLNGTTGVGAAELTACGDSNLFRSTMVFIDLVLGGVAVGRGLEPQSDLEISLQK
jgi:hypothetical protein